MIYGGKIKWRTAIESNWRWTCFVSCKHKCFVATRCGTLTSTFNFCIRPAKNYAKSNCWIIRKLFKTLIIIYKLCNSLAHRTTWNENKKITFYVTIKGSQMKLFFYCGKYNLWRQNEERERGEIRNFKWINDIIGAGSVPCTSVRCTYGL